MAITISCHGRPDQSGPSVTANGAGATDTLYIKGPPKNPLLYDGAVAGRYHRQVGGANGIWRWVEDYRLAAGTASPTGFTAENI